HVLLAAEAEPAVTTAARLDVDVRAIVEHRWERARARRASPDLPRLSRDRDEAPIARATELDGAVSEREDRVVAAEAGARAGPELCPALADDDHSRLPGLAPDTLHAESLRLGVATVARGAESFLVRH